MLNLRAAVSVTCTVWPARVLPGSEWLSGLCVSVLTTEVLSRCLQDFSWQVQDSQGPCPGVTGAEVKGQTSASRLGTAIISTSSMARTHRKCCNRDIWEVEALHSSASVSPGGKQEGFYSPIHRAVPRTRGGHCVPVC